MPRKPRAPTDRELCKAGLPGRLAEFSPEDRAFIEAEEERLRVEGVARDAADKAAEKAALAPYRLSKLEREFLLAIGRPDLSPREEEMTEDEVLGIVYRERPERVSGGCLRRLQHRLNRKLARAGVDVRIVRPRPGILTLAGGQPEDPAEDTAKVALPHWVKVLIEKAAIGQSPSPRDASKQGQSKLDSCQDDVRELLANGPIPSHALALACRRKGYRPDTVKVARKRLGVVAFRHGFGGDGTWFVRLPDRT